MGGAGESRLQVTDSPLHKLWVYLEQVDSDRVELLSRLAEATQDATDSVLSSLHPGDGSEYVGGFRHVSGVF